MVRVIGVVSGKGGVGKTVTSLNTALALHQFGQDVVVVDADITASNLGLHLGFYSFPNSLQDVLNGEVSVESAIYMHHTGLRVVPAAIDLNSVNANISKLRAYLHTIPADIVIVDSPPGLNEDSLSILNACDEVLVVTNPEIPTVANAAKVVKMAEKFRKPVLGVVVNRFTGASYELTPQEIEMMTEVNVYGLIPEDYLVKESIFQKVPVVAYKPYSQVAISFKQIAAKMIGKRYEPPRFLALKRLCGLK